MAHVLGTARGDDELLEVADAYSPVGVVHADRRRDRRAQSLDLQASGLIRASAGRDQRPQDRVGVLARPLGDLSGRLPPLLQARDAAVAVAKRVEDPPGASRPDTLEQLQQAKPAQLIGGVVGEAQERDEVLYVGRL